MKKINIIFVLALFGANAYGQETSGRPIDQQRQGNFMAGIAFDVVKSDFEDRIGNKLQGGVEIHYFLQQNFSVAIGTEMWTGNDSKLSGVAGIRYYPLKNIFIRARGLIGVDDISAGVGFQKMLSEQWTVEGMADYYLQGNVAARIGITFLFVENIYRQHRKH